MFKRLMPLALALGLSTVLSGCSVGLITSATPVRVTVGASNYSRYPVSNYYGRYAPSYRDGFYYSRYGYYNDSYFGTPFSDNLNNWSNSGDNCGRNCPSDVIEPATTQEALMPADFGLNLP